MFLSTLRSQWRHLRRSPSHSAGVILSLGVGMAVAVAAFSLTTTLVFRKVPGISERRTLIRIDWTDRNNRLTIAEFDALEADSPDAFSSLAGQGEHSMPVMLPSGPASLSVSFVSARFFETLGAVPLTGRLLGADDAHPAAAPVVVIGEALWQTAFNGKGDVLGSPIVVGGRAFTIVGVTPRAAPGLRAVDLGNRESDYPQLWLSLRDAGHWPGMPSRSQPWLWAAGRLSPDSTLSLAAAQTAVSGHRLSALPSSQRRGAFLRLFRAGLDFREEPGQSLLVIALFLFVPFCVLAIGCVNVINLQLARAMDLAGELSLRLALGASRARIIQSLTMEVVFLTAIAAIVGWLGAHWIVLRARAFFPGALAIDWTVFMFTLCLVTAVVAVTGLIPAWLTSRGVVAAGLRGLHDPTPRRSRLRGLLVVVQVAASLALVALSGLALRALTLGSPKLPPDAQQILLVDVDLRQVRPAEPRPGPFVSGILERLENEPSIHAPAVSTFVGAGGAVRYWLPADGREVVRVANGGFVTPGWFSAMNVTVLAGHLPARGAAVQTQAVISSALATTLGGGASVLGTRVRVQDLSGRGLVETEVVGVVADTETSIGGKPLQMLFLPMPAAAPPAFLLIARARDVPTARRAIADAMTETDPVVPLGRIESLDVRTSDLFRGFRETASFGLALGGLALTLAAAGLHSLLSYIVRRRTHEIGIRVAIGARTSDVVWLIVKPALSLVVAGTAAGLVLVVPLATIMRSALLGISPLEPGALLPSLGVLLVVSLIASSIPAYRAARVDPVEALRIE